jgi:hypothetical protein
MAALIRSLDWSATPPGPIDSWLQSLRTTVSLCLGSNFPINIIWGAEHTQIYNDLYAVVWARSIPPPSTWPTRSAGLRPGRQLASLSSRPAKAPPCFLKINACS